MTSSHPPLTLRTILLSLSVIFATAACGKADAAKSTTTASKIAHDTLPDSLLMAAADAGRYEGAPNANIWIVMISDFQCPYCRQWHDSTLAQVRKEYVATGKARLAYINLPLQGHKHAFEMAKAGLCASAQKKFWPYADAMFQKQTTVGSLVDVKPMLQSLADSLQIDTVAFNHCRNSSAITSLLRSDLRQADAAQIRSTPSFFVGQFILEGAVPFKTFKMAVDSALVVAAVKR